MGAHLALTFAAASGTGKVAEVMGVVAAGLLAAIAILAPSTRARAAAMVGALATAPVLLVVDIWDSPQVRTLRDRPAVAAALLAAALVAVVVLAVAVRRRPTLLPALAVAALPFRIPLSAGGSTASLLVPLYLVVAAGVLATAVPSLRAADDDAPHPARALEWLLAGAVVLYAVQSAWSADFGRALQQMAFFYVPFALLFCLLREIRWSRRLAAVCLGVLAGLALVFVGVGFVEYARKELFLNPKVITANQFESYFRVNSLFFDPNIYGRFLAMAMLAITTFVLWRPRGRDVLAGAVLLAVLWAGLILTLSQSSFAALLAGLAVLAAIRWSVARTAVAVGVAVAIGVAFVAIAPGALRLDLNSSAAADKATSGRADLIRGGVRLFADRPVLGYGSASFPLEYRRRESASSDRAVSASHTIPVTVAAEQGVIGLAVYLALLVAAFVRLGRATRERPLRAFVVAAFAALVVHTMLYAAFLEDPIAWALLGVGVATAGAARLPRPRAAAGEPEATAA